MLFSSVLLAQNKTLTEEPSRPIRNNASKIVEVKSMYIFERSKLSEMFSDKTIAADIPAYNYALSREENVKNVMYDDVCDVPYRDGSGVR